MKVPSRELSVAAALGLLLLALALFAPAFYDPQPLLSRLTAAAPKLLLAAGVALVILCRQIDISIGSLFALCSTGAGWLSSSGQPFTVTIAMTLALGAVAGAFNGMLVAGLRLPSIVVTLSTLVVWREALRLKQQGVFINLPDGIQWFGLPMASGQWIICAVSAAAFLFLAASLRHLSIGRWIYAVGSDAEAARLAGLRPRLLTFSIFLVMGLLVGLAALLNVVQSPQVDPIAAAVVGGIAISGGRGTLWGVGAGLLLLVCISPALTYVGVKPHWEKAIQGTIILLAVITDGLRARHQRG
jgi:rhamnose transport system permease protein